MRASQRGLSYWSVLFGVGLFGLTLKIAAVAGPVYLDYFTIDKMLQAKFRDPQVDKFELKAFRRELAAQMDRNNIRDRQIDDLMILSRDGDKVLIDLDYEERKKLFGNMDLVIHFKKTYSAEKPDGFVQ
jgi:hypothetical protein